MNVPFRNEIIEGLPIIIIPSVKVQKRKHRKRRINKKWAKRYGYRSTNRLHVDDDKILVMPDKTLFMSENAYEKLKTNLLVLEEVKKYYGITK